MIRIQYLSTQVEPYNLSLYRNDAKQLIIHLLLTGSLDQTMEMILKSHPLKIWQ